MEVSDEFVQLVSAAHAYATARQEILRREFALDSWPRWDWDQRTGQLVFSAGGAPRLVANVQFVGSVSTESNTWLWSWANPHVEASLTRDVREVRLLGEARGIAQLTTPKWPADEVDGWEMTSIAAYVLQAKGVYRTPRENGFTFMVMTSIGWADETPPSQPAGHEWPFADPRDVAAITTRQVLEDGHPILLVTHDADDGCWQVLCGTTNDPADGRVVGLGCIFERDGSIGELANLPRGWRAWRETPESPWVLEENPESDV